MNLYNHQKLIIKSYSFKRIYRASSPSISFYLIINHPLHIFIQSQTHHSLSFSYHVPNPLYFPITNQPKTYQHKRRVPASIHRPPVQETIFEQENLLLVVSVLYFLWKGPFTALFRAGRTIIRSRTRSSFWLFSGLISRTSSSMIFRYGLCSSHIFAPLSKAYHYEDF